MISSILKAFGGIRRAIRVRLFGNNQPITVNLIYKLFHSRAKQAWLRSRLPIKHNSNIRLSNELEREGFVQLEPTVDSELLEVIHREAGNAFAIRDSWMSPTAGTLRLKDGINTLPNISRLFTDEIVEIVENYYKSFFKIYWVQVYRTIPTVENPDASFLWHVDNCPQQVVKLMVYLTDTKENTGAFRLKPRPLSKELIDQGFWDRAKNVHFSNVLDDVNSTRVFEGPKGTSILFLNWACIHRAKHPQVDYRDVAVFFLIPSLVPWDQHLKENFKFLSQREDVCQNPTRV